MCFFFIFSPLLQKIVISFFIIHKPDFYLKMTLSLLFSVNKSLHAIILEVVSLSTSLNPFSSGISHDGFLVHKQLCELETLILNQDQGTFGSHLRSAILT